ncbi:MAG: VWA domain-containing protein, partial [Desulfamplus sp.]|nr:VWA domain-containing protein [Desulfamplus sp.]
MKKYNVIFAVMFSIMLLLSTSASAKNGKQPVAQTGYDVEVGPGVNVVDNNDGTHTILDTFDLYKGGFNNQDLTPADFIVYEDDKPVSATIVPPGSSTVQQKADIIFCMDISGSMGGSINAVKTNTQGFVSSLSQRNFDVQLGLITFGDYNTPYLQKRNNGQFYTSTADFLSDFNTLKANGWQEEWFDAIVLGSQYSFRPGASRVIILITDENGDKLNYDINTAIKAVQNNATTVYSITYNSLSNAVKAANETGGKVYDIKSNFNTILDSIAQQIANRYTVSYLSNAQPGLHKLKVEIAQNGNFDTADFVIGANPVIVLTPPTQTMVSQSVAPDGNTLTIGAKVTDDGSVVSVEIYGTDADANTYTGFMTDNSGIYEYSINAPASAGICFDFTIKAIDNEGRTTISGPFKVCASSDPPVIGNITPDQYDYNTAIQVTADITDPDNDLASVTLEGRVNGTLNWSNPTVMSANGNIYSGTLDAAIATGFGGVDLRVTATDKLGKTVVVEKTLTVKSVPVTIIDVTTHRDVIDNESNGEGPFSVYAVVAGVDLNISGNSINLIYTVNGGVQSSLP